MRDVEGLLRVYVDETGDRGMKAASSEYFAFAAVICRDSNRRRLLGELDRLVADLRKPPNQVLHWSRNLKDHADRRLATARFGALPVRTIYVIVPKSSIRPGSYLASSSEAYYNYAARLLLERVGMFTRRQESRLRASGEMTRLRAKVTFGRVKGFDPTVLRDYISKLRRTTRSHSWEHLTPQLAVDDQGTCR